MDQRDRPRPLKSGDHVPAPKLPRLVAGASGGKGGGRSGNGGNGHQPPRIAAASNPRRPPSGITPVFNAAAQKPKLPPAKTYEKQIADLRKLLSKPQPVRRLTPPGMDSNKPNSERDKAIQKHIESINAAVKKQRAKIKNDFAKAALRGTAKQSFNRVSRGR